MLINVYLLIGYVRHVNPSTFHADRNLFLWICMEELLFLYLRRLVTGPSFGRIVEWIELGPYQSQREPSPSEQLSVMCFQDLNPGGP